MRWEEPWSLDLSWLSDLRMSRILQFDHIENKAAN